jgi:hypothetical protein
MNRTSMVVRKPAAIYRLNHSTSTSGLSKPWRSLYLSSNDVIVRSALRYMTSQLFHRHALGYSEDLSDTLASLDFHPEGSFGLAFPTVCPLWALEPTAARFVLAGSTCLACITATVSRLGGYPQSAHNAGRGIRFGGLAGVPTRPNVRT